MKERIRFLCVLLSVVLTTSLVSAGQSGLKIPEQVTGDRALEHVEYLSEEIGMRIAGTVKEEETSDYIVQKLLEMGYDVELQPFPFVNWMDGLTYTSNNIIATKKGKTDKTVIIGAHYDSAMPDEVCVEELSTGAGDNASGVGVMLEVAEVLSSYRTKGTIKFVAFGAEEMGLYGSF